MEITGYSIERQIGKGGMASVYLAKQESLGRLVVLKILDISIADNNEELVERFLAEGRIVASLNHPNIITIHDIGITDDNALYISMEYIRGGDLKSRMGIAFDPDEALELLVRIGSGLRAAHKHDIIHRDIKPANILFRDDGTPLITDFGIAKRINEDLNLTTTGIFLGSPNYISPEQAASSDIDGRTDIYSLGCIFYELLTAKKPYIADTVFDVVLQHQQSPVPHLPRDLAEFQPLLNKMMAKNRKARFADITSLIDYIQQLQIRRNRIRAGLDPDGTGRQLKQPKKKGVSAILMVLLFLSATFFFSLQYIDIRLKDPKSGMKNVAIGTQIDGDTVAALENTAPAPSVTEPEPEQQATNKTVVSDDVINALLWLGKRSLEDYRLTSPPKDNAYYYYSRLLELRPGNKAAAQGILDIANRYAILAEKSVAENDLDKAETYISIGLKIDPYNKTLLSLRELNGGRSKLPLLERLKSYF